jgi:hypothetical protein
MSLWAIHKAIFEFLETAPATSRAVHAALNLLSALDSHHTRWAEEIAPFLNDGVRWN